MTAEDPGVLDDALPPERDGSDSPPDPGPEVTLDEAPAGPEPEPNAVDSPARPGPGDAAVTPVPEPVVVDLPGPPEPGLIPGEIRAADPDLDRPYGVEADRIRLEVANTGRRVIHVTSHYPFDRTNTRLAFDRAAARGFRLDLPAGASERWAPGEAKEVRLVRYAGMHGQALSSPPGAAHGPSRRPRRISAAESLARRGPTTGDRFRVADTDLWVRIAEDRTAPGDEPILGFAKNLRSRMTQNDRAPGASELDVLIAGVIVLDPALGAIKADIGIKDGRIAGIGRAGNPEITDGIDLVVGPHTAPIMGYGLVATPGGVDSHVHLLTPELLPSALSAGMTTLLTAGFEEPAYHMERTLRACEGWPLNIGLQAGARAERRRGLAELLEAGAIGFKIHEDYGSYPEIIDAVLSFADAHDVSVSLHTDGLHESAELEDTVAAINGRTVHAYHVEGTGGGHVPDLLGLVREPSILCSSTTPTIPYGAYAPVEHVAMTLLVHGGGWDVPGDLALVRQRIHPATMAAEGPLHELGAIGIINSDSQGMGRIGETLRRTLQLAHVMKAWRRGSGAPGGRPPSFPGLLPEPVDSHDDTERVLRYLAKCTLEPAIVHGISGEVGSLRPGRLADIVLWQPAYLGVKPAAVLKAGHLAWAALGGGNASLELAEPTRYRAHWGGHGTAAAVDSLTFVSGVVDQAAMARRLGTSRRLVAVSGTRGLTRADLARNRAVAPIEIDPGDGRVTLGGRPLSVDPVREVPLNRRYLLG